MRNSKLMMKNKMKQGMLLTALLMLTAQANALTVDLCAGVVNKLMQDGTTITMWGFGLDTSPLSATCASATVPGPALQVPVGDTSLTVNLRNTLPESTSIMVSGQMMATNPSGASGPVFFTDPQSRRRMQSFTHETAANGGTGVYSWTNLKSGTNLYTSGSHPAKQVPMGLYGTFAQSYTGINDSCTATLLYSEIDPVLNAAVAGGTYGTVDYPSTINYAPRYFLINGDDSNGSTPLPMQPKDPCHLRILNAGSETRVPTFHGLYVTEIAEDGNLYPYTSQSYSVLMPPGKAKDVLLSAADGNIIVYDRRLRLSDTAGNASGMHTLNVVAVAPPAGAAPVAVNDTDSTAEDIAKLVNVVGNDTDTDNDLDTATVTIVSQPLNGSAVSNAAGAVTYTPNANFNGADSFTYTVGDSAGHTSNVATVNVTVNPVNDAPVAVDDAYNATAGVMLSVAAAGVLTNDSDVDSAILTASVVTSPATGSLVLNSDGSFDFTGSTNDSFTYQVSDGLLTAAATVTITVTAAVNEAPVANNDYDTVVKNTNNPATNNTVTINVVANDTDSDGSIDVSTVVITTNPRKGVVTNNGDGTITYRPNNGRRGSDAFAYTVEDDGGAPSNVAKVRVDIIK